MESRISKNFAILLLLILLRSEDKLFFFRKTKKRFTNRKKCGILSESHRGVAQFGRALRSGRRGRKFESCHLDQLQKAELRFFVVQPFSLSGRFCEKQAFPKRRGENSGHFPYDCRTAALSLTRIIVCAIILRIITGFTASGNNK